MILIYGSHGYMGSAIVRECERRGIGYQRGVRGHFEALNGDVQLVINAAAFIPEPSVDACKSHQEKTITGNVLWPYSLSMCCALKKIPMMHLSTGCLFDEQREYDETDTPTRGWDGYCGFYVGTKLMAEKCVALYGQHYILRLRLPFDEVDHPRNYLSKLRKFDRVFEHVNSLTHRGDFAKWAMDLWEFKANYGTYHCVNTGQVPAIGIVTRMLEMGMISRMPALVPTTETSGARLSPLKLIEAGVPVRSVNDALCDSLKNWRTDFV